MPIEVSCITILDCCFCAQVGAIGPSANGGPFISSGFQTDHYSHVQSGHFQQPSYIQQSLQDQPLHFQSHQEQHAVIQPQQQVPPAHSQGINFQPKIFPSSVTEPSQRRAGNLQIPTNPRIISTLGMGTKVTSADSSQVRKPAYVAVSGKTSSKDTSNDSMLQVRFFCSNSYVLTSFWFLIKLAWSECFLK